MVEPGDEKKGKGLKEEETGREGQKTSQPRPSKNCAEAPLGLD